MLQEFLLLYIPNLTPAGVSNKGMGMGMGMARSVFHDLCRLLD
jgi:hypothetical protein